MENKVCENCKNYVAHYVISGTYLLEVEGHCIKHLYKKNLISKIEKARNSCEKWEFAKDEREKENESIFRTIREIKKRLTDIALILKTTDNSNKLQ